MPHFIQQFNEQLSELLPGNARVLLAVSGGLDSMTMLHAFADIYRRQPGSVGGLHVAHLNHLLRGQEAQLDAGLVRDLAKAMGLGCSIESIDIGRIAVEQSESIELTARKERYQFLARTAHENNCPYIALAHNADDNVETILHRIIRGTGIQGLAGIPPTRPLTPAEIGQTDIPNEFPLQLIRPLLTITRRQIQQYATEQNIPYRTDQSNFDEQFTRNRIRHELLPLLKEHYNPNIHTAITQLGSLSAMLAPTLTDNAQKTLTAISLEQSPTTLTLDAPRLSALPLIQQTQVIRQALIHLGTPQQRIGYKNITAVTRLLTTTDRNQAITLPYNVKVCTTPETLTITLPTEAKPKTPHPISFNIPHQSPLPHFQLPGILSTEQIILHALAQPGGPAEEKIFRQQKTTFQEMLDLDRLTLPLTVRTRQPGDTFHPLGAPGAKKLGDILTDQKIPVALRDTMPLICDQKGIIWLPGIRIAQRVKITPATKNTLTLSISDDQ